MSEFSFEDPREPEVGAESGQLGPCVGQWAACRSDLWRHV